MSPNDTFRPLHDFVLVQRAALEEKVGSLFVPAAAGKKSKRGTVIAAGPGKRDLHGVVHTLTVRPGDIVMFGEYAGSEIEFGGEVYLIIREDDLLGIVGEGS